MTTANATPCLLGKPTEGHGERASIKNNTCGSSSSISQEKEETFSGKQRLKKYPDMTLIPTRYLGVSFCLKEVS